MVDQEIHSWLRSIGELYHIPRGLLKSKARQVPENCSYHCFVPGCSYLATVELT
jgi:hypothetical protein